MQLKNTFEMYGWPLTSQFHRLDIAIQPVALQFSLVWPVGTLAATSSEPKIQLESWQKYFHRLAIAMQPLALWFSFLWPLSTCSAVLMNWDEFDQSKSKKKILNTTFHSLCYIDELRWILPKKKSEEKSAKYQLHWLSYIDELNWIDELKCTPLQFFIAKADPHKNIIRWKIRVLKV